MIESTVKKTTPISVDEGNRAVRRVVDSLLGMEFGIPSVGVKPVGRVVTETVEDTMKVGGEELESGQLPKLRPPILVWQKPSWLRSDFAA